MRLTLIAITALLSGCLPGEVFYTGQLSERDQAIFAEAARIEGAEVVDDPLISAWRVEYELMDGLSGLTVHSEKRILIDPEMPIGECTYAQRALVVFRHEIGHTQGKGHSNDSTSVMHSPAPCYPTD